MRLKHKKLVFSIVLILILLFSSFNVIGLQNFKNDNKSDKYDLVIITPRRFYLKLLPLVNHKNNNGIQTLIKTTENIYLKYEGRDKPEQIKFFIKDAIETHGIEYVLLVGGMKYFKRSWYVPVRYSNLDDQAESSYISDLYYADVYKKVDDKLVFDDWDSNGNSVFAEWNSQHKDVLDLIPDVCVGRLACRNRFEVDTVVKKIINYESNTYGKEWFDRMVLVAGDTFPSQDSFYEGEIETNFSASFMKPLGFDITRLWTSTKMLNDSGDVIREISDGAGFVHFVGHGDPSIWSTYAPNKGDEFIDGLSILDVSLLNNGNKLPVCVIGGCHNSQFDVSLLNILFGLREEGLKYFDEDEGSFFNYNWVRECLGWRIVSKRNGGAIATIGNTGVGWRTLGEDCFDDQGGWIESRFFYCYSQGNKTLGNAHSQAITDYVNTFKVNSYYTDRKTVEQWALLGDPSLKIGGYS